MAIIIVGLKVHGFLFNTW